jgi:hypothetical protein
VQVCGGELSSVDAGGCRVTEPVDGVGGSDVTWKSGNAAKPSADGMVRIDVGVVFHLDVLKPSLPTEQASDAVHCAHTKEQMSLDLEDLW